MKLRIFLVIWLLPVGMVACSTSDETSLSGKKQVTVDEPKHVTVYFEKGMFGGWPANHGIWSWGNEILVGFGMGYNKDQGRITTSIGRSRRFRCWPEALTAGRPGR